MSGAKGTSIQIKFRLQALLDMVVLLQTFIRHSLVTERRYLVPDHVCY